MTLLVVIQIKAPDICQCQALLKFDVQFCVVGGAINTPTASPANSQITQEHLNYDRS